MADRSRYRQMLAHALVALGKPLRCEEEICVCSTRDEFDRDGPRRISFDHEIPEADGGTHRPDNLRFAHLCCNVSQAARGKRERLDGVVHGPMPDEYDQLAPIQQALVDSQHGPQDLASRWRFESGNAIPIRDEAEVPEIP